MFCLQPWVCLLHSHGRHKQNYTSCVLTRTTNIVLSVFRSVRNVRVHISKWIFPLLLGNLILLSFFFSPPLNSHLRVFAEKPPNVHVVSGRRGEAVSKRDQDKGRRRWRQEERQAGRSLMVEEDEAPDLTALTHLGLFLLANCWLWSTLRGPTRTYIYLWTHTSDENILLVFQPACVGDVRVSLCILESLHVTEILLSLFVSFLHRCFYSPAPLFCPSSQPSSAALCPPVALHHPSLRTCVTSVSH